MIIIKIKEINTQGHIKVRIESNGKIKQNVLTEWSIGRTEEEICKLILQQMKELKSEGELKL